MTTKERFVLALQNKKPDRLPVTTHDVMPYYLNKYEGGCDKNTFFERHGLDKIDWFNPYKPDSTKGQYFSDKNATGYEGIVSDTWRITTESIADDSYRTIRYNFDTPDGHLSMVVKHNEYTRWVCEHLIKEHKDLDVIIKNAPVFLCDIDQVRAHSEAMGQSGLVRSIVPSFDVYGQPGCWQDASILFGIENLIYETFDDPDWVKEMLLFLQKRKIAYLDSMVGAPMDLLELGGGDASTTVISPNIFKEFVAPFDTPVIEAAHKAGQKIVYHTCGGMMPILEDIAAMNPDAMETFTPPGIGGDIRLAEAFDRIGDKVCFIGGLDQGHYLVHATPQEMKAEVHRCFDACGREGGFILAPSDHFFHAQPKLFDALSEAAMECIY